MTHIEFHIDRPAVDYVNEVRRGERVSRQDAPDYLFFRFPGIPEKKKSSLRDMFSIFGGVFVISEKFHDLLSQFELGDGRMFEVPLYENDQKTRRPGRWYILHVAAQKPTVIPEKSENLESGNGRWRPRLQNDDVLAVRASSAQGADIWLDPVLSNRMFLTDRLKTAIKQSDLKIRSLPMRPCVVID